MTNANKTPVITEVVLELEGKGLLSGVVGDFILSPTRGSEYFYEGCLYEVVHAIETIGDASSPQGSMLIDLLSVLYPEPEKATSLFGGMKKVNGGDKVDPDQPIILSSGSVLVMGGAKERLLYLRLKLVQGAVQKSFITQLAEMAAAGGAKKS